MALLVGLASFASCRDASDADRIDPTPAHDAPANAATQATAIVDGRVRFDPRHRPVLVAPDGSRRTIASMLALPGRMRFGDYRWRDLNSPDAPLWIKVDLARQLLSVFRGGDEIGTAVLIYGTDGKKTPSGVFPIRGKERLHRSRAYDADMPFTLWLTADGIAIHASAIKQGRATHGCVGVPAAFAAKLFAVAERGDVVIISPASDPPEKRAASTARVLSIGVDKTASV